MHVLVVDDSEGMRTMVAAVLQAAGCRVDIASDGASGLARFMADPPDAIMTDINMPGMDGLTFISRVRDQPRGGAMPIFVLSSDECPGKHERARAYGVSRWMAKPMDLTTMVTAVIQSAA